MYVNVFAKFDKDGNVTPVWIEWGDGTIYEVNRIMETTVRKDKRLETEEVCYFVQIGQRKTRLLYDKKRWSVIRR
jgi:hypothetical protein